MEVIQLIREWAMDRNLIDGSNPAAQMIKLREEVQELADAIANDDDSEISDAIGDCFVVLTIIALQKDFFVEDCIEWAYEQIKDRKGKMVDGIFVKEANND